MPIVFVAVALFLFVPATGSRKRPGSSPDDRTPGVIARDDSRYWLGGLIYYNPDDPDAFVPKRFGWGWTVSAALRSLPLPAVCFGRGFGAQGGRPWAHAPTRYARVGSRKGS